MSYYVALYLKSFNLMIFDRYSYEIRNFSDIYSKEIAVLLLQIGPLI